MMELCLQWETVGIVGVISLLIGCVGYYIFSYQKRFKHVDQFTDMGELKQHLTRCPNKKAKVLIEGIVMKSSEALKTEHSSPVEGAAKYVTTSNDTEFEISVPFHLADRSGNMITVQFVHRAEEFRQILDRVWQGDVTHNQRENTRGISARYHLVVNEYLLLFGSSMGAYGEATLIFSSDTVRFVPSEVNSSIDSLISCKEEIVRVHTFLPTVFCFVIAGGVTLLLIAFVLLVMSAVPYTSLAE